MLAQSIETRDTAPENTQGTYEWYNAYLGTEDTKVLHLPRRVFMSREDGDIVISVLGAPILRFSPDGSVTFNTRGFRTALLKSRMNLYLPSDVRVVARDRVWYLVLPGQRWVEYEDRMVLHANGEVTYNT